MTKATTHLFVALTLVASIAPPTIIVRHDQEDAQHVDLGQQFEGALVHMNLEAPGERPDGEGTLVGLQWVLTAAHVAVEAEPGHELTIAGANYEAAAIFAHAAWDGGATDDIALIKLKTPVVGVDPVGLYPHKDEVGQLVTVVGRGDIGTGATGPTENIDRKVRGATNKVDGANDALLWWRFDAPGDSTGNATELEGISGPGDSGGPAFIEVEGERYVAGVSSTQSTRATGGQEGVYGVTEYYARVSGYLDWIAQVIKENS